MGQPGALPSCVERNYVYSKMNVFEMNVSVIKSLMSGTDIIIKKAKCQIIVI